MKAVISFVAIVITTSSLFAFVQAISECVPTGEDMSDFQCFARQEPMTQELLCQNTDERCEAWKKRGMSEENPERDCLINLIFYKIGICSRAPTNFDFIPLQENAATTHSIC